MRSVVLYPETVEPEKLLATAVYGGEMYAVRGSYDDCSRLVVELAGELDWAFVNVNLRAYYAEGSKTLAFEIGRAARLGAARRRRLAGRLGLALHEALAGVRAVPRGSASSTGERRGIYGGQAEGCSPGRRMRSPTSAARVAGAPGDARAFARDRRARRRRPRDRDRARVGRRDLRGARRTTSAPNMSLLAGTRGVFGETAAGVTIGALRAAAAAGEIGEGDRVVALVTGTGPEDAAGRSRCARASDIDADVDELLDGPGSLALRDEIARLT